MTDLQPPLPPIRQRRKQIAGSTAQAVLAATLTAWLIHSGESLWLIVLSAVASGLCVAIVALEVLAYWLTRRLDHV